MVNIAHYYGNGNKNNEISPHTGQNGIIKKSTKKKKKQMLEWVWRKGNALALCLGM